MREWKKFLLKSGRKSSVVMEQTIGWGQVIARGIHQFIRYNDEVFYKGYDQRKSRQESTISELRDSHEMNHVDIFFLLAILKIKVNRGLWLFQIKIME